MSIEEEAPNGVCPCGMVMMLIDGKKQCPRCKGKDVVLNPPSGLVNTLGEVSEDEVVSQTSRGMSHLKRETVESLGKIGDKVIKTFSSETFEEHLSSVDEMLRIRPADDMQMFKKILKLRKKVNDLRFEIKTLLGE